MRSGRFHASSTKAMGVASHGTAGDASRGTGIAGRRHLAGIVTGVLIARAFEAGKRQHRETIFLTPILNAGVAGPWRH